MNTIKITAEDKRTFESYGKPRGGRKNFTGGVRTVLQMWVDAGRPELPDDPCPWGGHKDCDLIPCTSRYGATFEALKDADGCSAGSGARRLALWVRERQEAAQ